MARLNGEVVLQAVGQTPWLAGSSPGENTVLHQAHTADGCLVIAVAFEHAPRPPAGGARLRVIAGDARTVRMRVSPEAGLCGVHPGRRDDPEEPSDPGRALDFIVGERRAR